MVDYGDTKLGSDSSDDKPITYKKISTRVEEPLRPLHTLNPTRDTSNTDLVDSPDHNVITYPSVSFSSPPLIKRGFRELTSDRTCGVLFESDPIWLWSLRPNSWATIYVTVSDDERIRRDHQALFLKIQDKMVIIPSTFSTDFPSVSPDFMFVSGSKSFIKFTSMAPVGTHIYWMSNCPRRLPLDSIDIHWSKISHRSVGGVTNARGTFGIDIRSDPIRLQKDLNRTIGHIIKYSIRPKICESRLEMEHYVLSDMFSLSFPRRPVLYPTYMSRTGWGYRELCNSELAMAFELPDFVPWDDRFLRDILPCQMFRSVIDSVTEAKGSEPSKVKPKLSHIIDIGISQDVIWLPGIGRWLSGAWADADISDKAVKSDNSPVDFKPWHRRIQLVLPCSTNTLGIMERFATRKWRLNVCRSLFSYIGSTYGSYWRRKFFSTGKRKLADSVEAPGKRARLSIKSGSTTDTGGVLGKVLGKSTKSASSVYQSSKRRDIVTDISKGLLVLGQILRSSWWEWTSGSAPLFWRWNGIEKISAARDGMHIFVQSPLPRSRKGVKLPRFDLEIRKLVSSKVLSMVEKSYLEAGFVRTSLHYFAVPKGDSDIRVVFDGTSCGLNEALWSPNFFLPTSRNASELLSFESWMADVDFGEFFHNFFADERIRKHAGVDISPLGSCFSSGQSDEIKFKFTGLRWGRLFMGMRPSPYNAVRFYYWAEEFAIGNLRAPSNPFSFDKVILNLPGMQSYDPLRPKLMKWNSEKSFMAGDVVTFVDDVRITGSSREHCHDVHRQFTSRVQYLGLQDAPRKFRPPSQGQAGAWTGTIFKVSNDVISKTVSQEKWLKGQAIIQILSTALNNHPFERPLLNHKELERNTGFLNHLTMTFEEMTPYLKGFYLTLNSWRPKRDKDDWKLPDKTWLQCLSAQLDNGSISEDEFERQANPQNNNGCPRVVTASSRLGDDVRALALMFTPHDAPEVSLRSKEIVTVIYGFGDASGTGLGATFTCGSGFNFRVGVWSSDDSNESSNWREFTNIVESLEDEAKAGQLSHSEVFMFTDNSTVESCAYRGSSSSPKLLGLVVRLRALTPLYGIKLHIFHVAGTRMIAQGTDGVSRGFLGEGIMSGEAMVSFIPIHLSACERSPNLINWIKDWSDPLILDLRPIDWYDVGHDIDGWQQSWDGFDRPRLVEGRTYLWTPPPFAADIAISELRRARIKRQTSSHLFVVPKLCAPLWIKQVYKAADLVFEIPPGQPFWDKSMHEPLLIAIVFPFIRSKPWQLRATPKMYSMGSELRKMLKIEGLDVRDFLRKFWSQCHRLRFMPENVVRKVLYFGSSK